MQMTTNTEAFHEVVDTQAVIMPTKDRYLLIDDDPVYRAIAEATATKMGIMLSTFSSIAEMGYFARIKEFAAVILDYNLEHLNGLEIAEYIDTFFKDIPVILVTGLDPSRISFSQWPQCVRDIVTKSRPVKDVISTIVGLRERQVYLQSLG